MFKVLRQTKMQIFSGHHFCHKLCSFMLHLFYSALIFATTSFSSNIYIGPFEAPQVECHHGPPQKKGCTDGLVDEVE